jgi:signal transduction histidine kinase
LKKAEKIAAEDDNVTYLKDSLVYLYGIGEYSPFLLSLSNFDLSSSVDWIVISNWFIGGTSVFAILIILYLLFEIFGFIRRESKTAKQQLELLYAVAHELKTPMGVVMLHGEKVLEEHKASEKDKRATLMLNEIQGMNQRLMDVLAQSKLEGGRHQMNRESINLREHAEAVAEGYEPLAEDKNISVEVAGEDLLLYADGYLIKYAISNYLSNAIKHCPEGGQVKINVQKKKRSVVLTVWNEGSHIPQSNIGRIWDPFYKVGDGGDNAKKGSGLGLSIVRSIVTLHGGSCGVRNTPDGVAFWCAFPIRKGMKRRQTS